MISMSRVLAVDLSARKDRTVDYEDLPTALSLLRNRAIPGRERLSVPNIVSLIMKSSLVASAAHTRAMREQADPRTATPCRRPAACCDSRPTGCLGLSFSPA